MDAIKTADLTKVYGRKGTLALEDLSLQVTRGELFGFLGPNGAGKTTTIRILMTLLRPTRGQAWIGGHDVRSEPLEAMRRVGFMPENPGFYRTMTGRQHLRYWARLYGMRRGHQDGDFGDLLERVGLAEAADKKTKAYSLGMKRRLALAGVLLPDPEILILDEPSLGLDPGGMAFVRSLLTDLHGQGRTIFLSSHILSEVEKICTRVGVLHHGRLLQVETPRALVQALGRASGGLEVETKGVEPNVSKDLESIDGVEQVAVEGTVLRVSGSLDDDAIAEVTRRLVAAGVAILGSRRLEPNLEEAFLALTEGEA
ncbi:MAG: ABC transporter ATP-binding protein [Thermoplasmata archaeon]